MRFGLPRDAAQWIVLGLGALALVARSWPRARRAIRSSQREIHREAGRRGDSFFSFSPSPRLPVIFFLGLAALAAALLSAAYIQVYLRGGPRIIDATSYWLEARALAAGHL